MNIVPLAVCVVAFLLADSRPLAGMPLSASDFGLHGRPLSDRGGLAESLALTIPGFASDDARLFTDVQSWLGGREALSMAAVEGDLDDHWFELGRHSEDSSALIAAIPRFRVPLPAALPMFGSALAGLAVWQRRRRDRLGN